MIRRLVAGHALGQLALIAVIPFLSRLLSSAEFGYYQACVAGGVVASYLMTWRLEAILPSAPDHATLLASLRDGHRRLALTAGLAAVLIVLTFALGYRDLSAIILGSGLYGALLGIQLLDNARLLHQRQTRRLAARNVLSGVLSAASQVATAFVAPSALAIIVAFGLGRMAAVALTRSPSLQDETRGTPMRVPWTMPAAGVLGALSSQIPIFVLLGMGHASSAGQVAAALRLSSAPLSFLGTGLNQAVQATVAAEVRAEHSAVTKAVIRLARRSVPFGLFAAVSVLVVGLFLGEVILGPGWGTAQNLMVALALPSGLQVIASALVGTLPLIGHTATQLVLEASKTVLVGIAAFVWSDSAQSLATALLVALTIGHVATFLTVLSTARKYDLQQPRDRIHPT